MATSLFLGMVLLTVSTGFLGSGPRVSQYDVEGYLDEAPAGVKTIGEAHVGRGEDSRILHIVAYHNGTPFGDHRIGEVASDPRKIFDLVGDPGSLDGLLESPEGSFVRIGFVRRNGGPILLVHDTEIEPRSTVSQQR